MYDLVCKQVMVLPGAPHTPFIIVKEYPPGKSEFYRDFSLFESNVLCKFYSLNSGSFTSMS